MLSANSNNILKLASILAVVTLICSCYSTVCPGYPDEYMNWMPYRSAMNISFTDETETIRLHVGETYRSLPHKTSSWIIEPFCLIEATANISGDAGSPEIKIHSMYMYDPREEADYNYSISGNTIRDADGNILYSGFASFNFQSRDNEITTDYYITADLLASYYNGHKEYTNVLKLENDTTLNYYKPWVYQVYIAENVGIIQFTELRSKKVWSLIEE